MRLLVVEIDGMRRKMRRMGKNMQETRHEVQGKLLRQELAAFTHGYTSERGI